MTARPVVSASFADRGDRWHGCRRAPARYPLELRRRNLANRLDAFSLAHGHHVNVNVFNRETLVDAMERPGKYPQLTTP
jgi:hypothetical protein